MTHLQDEQTLQTRIITISDFLKISYLDIPAYQRPYKWSVKNVLQLIMDIEVFKTMDNYRLGTVILHENIEKGKKKWDIVDGQQRTISLLLIIHAVANNYLDSIQSRRLTKQIKEILSNAFSPRFSSNISFKNIQDNFNEINRKLSRLELDSFLDFLLNHCEVTLFILTNISEAFQFFDSQNARGKDLEPHDLLKAFHLREFSDDDKHDEERIVNGWEEINTEDLSELFSNFLYRVKGWSKGESSRYFSKNHVHMFKGINLKKVDDFPYTRIFDFTNRYVNKNTQSNGFPFQLDQIVINGRRFFEMVDHYNKMRLKFRRDLVSGKDLQSKLTLQKIFETIKSYRGRYRTGDTYVRLLFDCSLLYYIDKFGYADIEAVVEKIFIWSYSLRLKYQSLQLASVDNYVLSEFNMFKSIRDSFTPSDVFTRSLPDVIVHDSNLNNEKTQDILNLFKELKYYES